MDAPYPNTCTWVSASITDRGLRPRSDEDDRDRPHGLPGSGHTGAMTMNSPEDAAADTQAWVRVNGQMVPLQDVPGTRAAGQTGPRTITDFLLERIAEDVLAARAAAWDDDDYLAWELAETYGSWDVTAVTQKNGRRTAITCDSEGIYDSVVTIEAGQHIARWDPARVLAVCQANKQLVLDFIEYDANADAISEPTGLLGRVAERALEHMAALYADHPDYDPAWSPT